MIGKKLGPYEILASIGSGGMGEVWKARDTRLGRIVAIKKVKEQHSERFKQEARSIAALNHPNISQIFDIGDDYLVLEYVEGKPLSNPLPEQEAVKLAIQIATALEAAHKKGIIHRDLKPSNIMVSDEGIVKLLTKALTDDFDGDLDETIDRYTGFYADRWRVDLVDRVGGTLVSMNADSADPTDTFEAHEKVGDRRFRAPITLAISSPGEEFWFEEVDGEPRLAYPGGFTEPFRF